MAILRHWKNDSRYSVAIAGIRSSMQLRSLLLFGTVLMKLQLEIFSEIVTCQVMEAIIVPHCGWPPPLNFVKIR